MKKKFSDKLLKNYDNLKRLHRITTQFDSREGDSYFFLIKKNFS